MNNSTPYFSESFQKQSEEDIECFFSFSSNTLQRKDSANVIFGTKQYKYGELHLKRNKGIFDGTYRWRIYKREDTKWVEIRAQKATRKNINPLLIPVIFDKGAGEYLVEIYNSELLILSFAYVNVSVAQ